MATKSKPPRHPDPAPFEIDDLRVVGVATTIWLIVGLAMLPFWDQFRRDGHLWWIATAFSGFGLGLFGMNSARKRRTAMRALAKDAPKD